MEHDLDKFIETRVVPFHKKNVDALIEKHPHIIGMVNAILANRDNRAAIQVTENGKVTGEYTLHLNGLNIAKVDCGTLASQFHHPFLGVIKPYFIIEKSVLERILADESSYLTEPFSAVVPYLKDITVKFLG